MQVASSTEKAITVFEAKEIITLDHTLPQARYVAVKDGRILAVAHKLEDMSDWLTADNYTLNRDFARDVMVPGFYEAHTHIHLLGYFWQYPYVGRFDRRNPEGTMVPGCATKQEVLQRIQDAVKAADNRDKVVIVWGYQPSFYDDGRMGLEQLDPITGDCPVVVVNINLHEMYVNSAALRKAGMAATDTVVGFVKEYGMLTGEAQEEGILKLYPIFPDMSEETLAHATDNVFKIAQRVGVTTIVDAAFGLIPHGYQAMKERAHSAGCMRVILYPFIRAIMSKEIQSKGGFAYIKELKRDDSPWLKFGAVKVVIDGSLQAKTARLYWPYYLDGTNGVFNIELAELKTALIEAFKQGLQVTMHANGDEALGVALEATHYALQQVYNPDHRTRIEHCQLPHMDQIKRMRNLGMNASMLTNHIYYWGDVHWHKILGSNRAHMMHPLKTMLAHDIVLSLHSDVVSPISPLLAMWVAVNRKTISGVPLGKDEALTPLQALQAVTIGPAYQQFEDHCKGSIEVGKYADFTILKENPLQVAPDAIKDIAVRATVVDGKVFLVE